MTEQEALVSDIRSHVNTLNQLFKVATQMGLELEPAFWNRDGCPLVSVKITKEL